MPGQLHRHRGPCHCSSCLGLPRALSPPHTVRGQRDEGGEMSAASELSRRACQGQWGRKPGPRLRAPAQLPRPAPAEQHPAGKTLRPPQTPPPESPAGPQPQPGPSSTLKSHQSSHIRGKYDEQQASGGWGRSPKGPGPGRKEAPATQDLAASLPPAQPRLQCPRHPAADPLRSGAPAREGAGKDPSLSPHQGPFGINVR